MSTLIVEPTDVTPRAVAILRDLGPVELGDGSRAALHHGLAEFDAVWIRLGTPVRGADLRHRRRARVLASATTGLDHIDLEACAEAGLQVISLSGETAFLREVRATAEATVMLMLSALRSLPAAHEHVLSGGWDRDRFRGRELDGAVVGIVGLGRLGTMVADLCSAFRAQVIAYDIDPTVDHGGVDLVSLKQVAALSDIISIHANFAPDDEPIVDSIFLDDVKPGAVLVNTARGGLIDGVAVAAAVSSGRLGAVAVDVLDGEPRVAIDNPLVAAARRGERVIITPHLGGCTYESTRKTEIHIAERIVSAVRSSTAGE